MAKINKLTFPGHTITLTDAGFLGYTHYRCTRDSDGANIAAGGISRENYATARQHKAAILKTCMDAAAAHESLSAKA